MVTFDEDENLRQLAEFRKKEEEDLAQFLADRHGVKYVNLSGIPIEADALKLVAEERAREAELAPFAVAGKILKVAVISPLDPATKEILSELEAKGFKLEVFMVSHRSLEKAWGRYTDITKTEEADSGVVDLNLSETERTEVYTTAQKIKTVLDREIQAGRKVTDIVEIILESAVVQGASDIHIEPQENDVHIRMRLDGILIPITTISTDSHESILSRLKILSGLKLNVETEPQDGRFSIKAGETEVEVRTSIIPGAFGESVVMRLLNPDATKVSIETLGIDEVLLSKIKSELKKPNGMILTTGPTGSGKTTALYAFLKVIHEPGIKIITIENPVEYRLPGIVQTQVDKQHGYDFYDGLKSAMRQDPDVIMVGEIRDENTAKTAVQAALTGHLVFSTLHTNDAVGAIPRMRDLDVKEDVLGASLNIILAQRLVRKLKKESCEEVEMTEKEKLLIETIMKGVEEARWKHLFEKGTLLKPRKGVEDHEAYLGRTGIYEALIIDQETEDLIRARASLVDIEISGRKKYNILSLREHGVLNVLNGVTDLEELERVVALIE